jgi:hypothetical protein
MPTPWENAESVPAENVIVAGAESFCIFTVCSIKTVDPWCLHQDCSVAYLLKAAVLGEEEDLLSNH